jgi:predicted metal-dependent phosphoesterase TrpH
LGRVIDPHYHTKQSDGESTILESIASAWRKGLAALVITDHLSANTNWIAATRSYRKNIQIMKQIRHISRETDYPVIIGIELYLPAKVGFGEVLVFGTEICAAIQDHLSELAHYDLEEFKKFKDRFECAIVQCHPKFSVQEQIVPILDGCEVTKAGIARPNHDEILEDCKKHNLTPIASSDGHVAFLDPRLVYEVQPYLGKAYTIFSIDINNEKDLIRAIKQNLIEKRVFPKEDYRSNRNIPFI